MRFKIRHLMTLAASLLAAAAFAADPVTGIVLMHGKWDKPPTHVLTLVRHLEGEGYKVAAPLMPWSGSREYDVGYPQALEEIDAAVAGLRAKGAQHIVVAGLSFGANAALAYAASGHPVDAVVALSPGHTPDFGPVKNAVEPSVKKARAMVDAGQGAERDSFEDRNQGKARQVRTTAAVYLSYFDPEGLV